MIMETTTAPTVNHQILSMKLAAVEVVVSNNFAIYGMKASLIKLGLLAMTIKVIAL
jgi:hypothetical protein